MNEDAVVMRSQRLVTSVPPDTVEQCRPGISASSQCTVTVFFPTSLPLFTSVDYWTIYKLTKYPEYVPDHLQNLINSSLVYSVPIFQI